MEGNKLPTIQNAYFFKKIGQKLFQLLQFGQFLNFLANLRHSTRLCEAHR